MTQKTPFRTVVLQVVRGIKKGQVMSYGAVALRAGFPGAGRAVGTLMKQNRDSKVPCHRVVRADGTVGQYNRGIAQKIALLKQEGIVIIGRKVVKRTCV